RIPVRDDPCPPVGLEDADDYSCAALLVDALLDDGEDLRVGEEGGAGRGLRGARLLLCDRGDRRGEAEKEKGERAGGFPKHLSLPGGLAEAPQLYASVSATYREMGRNGRWLAPPSDCFRSIIQTRFDDLGARRAIAEAAPIVVHQDGDRLNEP